MDKAGALHMQLFVYINLSLSFCEDALRLKQKLIAF